MALGSPPEWADRFKIPSEGKNKEKIQVLEEKIRELTFGKLKLQEEENYLTNFKGLLYEQGKHGLEPLVREALRVLGFQVYHPEDYEEEYDIYAEEDDILVIGEAEGSVKQIGVRKYRQLLHYVDQKEIKGAKCKGILIGNGFLEIDPEDREQQFSPETINGCELRRFCALNTYQLYKMVRDVLVDNREVVKKKLRMELLDCAGEYRYLSTSVSS